MFEAWPSAQGFSSFLLCSVDLCMAVGGCVGCVDLCMAFGGFVGCVLICAWLSVDM